MKSSKFKMNIKNYELRIQNEALSSQNFVTQLRNIWDLERTTKTQSCCFVISNKNIYNYLCERSHRKIEIPHTPHSYIERSEGQYTSIINGIFSFTIRSYFLEPGSLNLEIKNSVSRMKDFNTNPNHGSGP